MKRGTSVTTALDRPERPRVEPPRTHRPKAAIPLRSIAALQKAPPPCCLESLFLRIRVHCFAISTSFRRVHPWLRNRFVAAVQRWVIRGSIILDQGIFNAPVSFLFGLLRVGLEKRFPGDVGMPEKPVEEVVHQQVNQ
jgi:hypothetical protein